MRIIVTGGAGFIGSNLCRRLLADGHETLALDSFNDFYDPALKRENIRRVRLSDAAGRFRVAETDIRDAQALDALFDAYRPEAVVHLAAYAGVRPSIDNPALYVDVNLMGTTRILDAMTRHGVRRLVFASSSSVYGNNKKVPFSEADPVDHPISPYAATKKAGELLVHTYHALHGVSCACLRFFTVYGPGQRPDLAISKFIALMRAGKPIPVYGDGSTRRDYTYIGDIVNGIVAALEWTGVPGRYDVFNLGESHTVSLSEMIQTIERVLGKKAVIERLPMQPGDVQQTYADVSKARAALGYAPDTAFEDGIEKYVAWLDAAGKDGAKA